MGTEGVGDEEDGGGESGGRATGAQKRGSKQGEALTSACFTLERERWTESRMEKGGETGRQTARKGEEQRKQQHEKQRSDGASRVQFPSMARRWQQSAEVLLTKLRLAGKPRDATTVPLRLRPIRLGVAASPGSTPKCKSCNAIGCQGPSQERKTCTWYLAEVGGVPGAPSPVCTPLQVCVGGLGAGLPPHPGYQPL